MEMEQKTSKYKLLIADDELLLTRTLKNVLTRYGYDIHICNRGGEVLSALEHFQEGDAGVEPGHDPGGVPTGRRFRHAI